MRVVELELALKQVSPLAGVLVYCLLESSTLRLFSVFSKAVVLGDSRYNRTSALEKPNFSIFQPCLPMCELITLYEV